MEKLTNEEIKNLIVLAKAGAKTIDLNGKQMIAIGALIAKCEGLLQETNDKENTEGVQSGQ